MNISKDRILQFLTDRSRSRLADQAAGELPGQVGTDQDAGLLAKFGIGTRQNYSAKAAEAWAICSRSPAPEIFPITPSRFGLAYSGQSRDRRRIRMTNTQTPETYMGRTAVDAQGNKIGSVGQVYVSDETGVPDWITVNRVCSA